MPRSPFIQGLSKQGRWFNLAKKQIHPEIGPWPPTFEQIRDKPTTLAGYGITDGGSGGSSGSIVTLIALAVPQVI